MRSSIATSSDRVAAHLYPTEWAGIEIAGQYGRLDQFNDFGGRVAAGISIEHVSLTAGASTI